MLNKLWRDLISKPPKIIYDFGEELNFYYFQFEDKKKKLNRLIHSFDENGVPINKTYIDVENGQPHYYPISIGQYGLAIFHTWLKSKEKNKNKQFLNIADWFVENQTNDENLGAYWLTNVPKPEFHVTQPWKSAFSQSRAISILLRAWQITKEPKYANTASKALLPFTFSIYDGGVAADFDSDKAFFEEYVAEKPTRVLDGAIFSMFGIMDYARVSKNPDFPLVKDDLTEDLIKKGINGLKYWLPKFDMGYWVYYNRCELAGYPQNDPCTIGYLKLVVAQLRILARYSNDQTLLDYSNKFEEYLRFKNIIKMYRQKFIALKKLNRL